MTVDTAQLETIVLALQNIPEFGTFMQALVDARDSEYQKFLNLSPTADPLEVQRRLGNLEGLDTLCDAPAAMLKAAQRKRTHQDQQYAGRNEIPTYSTEDEDD